MSEANLHYIPQGSQVMQGDLFWKSQRATRLLVVSWGDAEVWALLWVSEHCCEYQSICSLHRLPHKTSTACTGAFWTGVVAYSAVGQHIYGVVQQHVAMLDGAQDTQQALGVAVQTYVCDHLCVLLKSLNSLLRPSNAHLVCKAAVPAAPFPK